MRRRNEQSIEQQGVAVIAVLASLAILGGAVAEFSTDTTVDAVSASNARDEMQTHFLAVSGANLAHLVVRVQTDVVDKFRDQLGDFQIADYAGMFMGAFGGRPDERDALAELLGGFKADAIKGLGVAVGGFDVVITTDDGRINMNCANGTQQTQEVLKTQLEALFYFEAFDPIFESEDAEGWRRDRATQASALIDYIDRDRAGFGQPGTMEEYGYETLDDRYRAKNNYIDTIGELKMVRGIDDRMWTLFGDAFTAYGDCKVNIGAVQDAKLIAAILFLAAKNPDDPVVKDTIKLWALSRFIVQERENGVYFDDLQAFADFVKDPQGSVASLYQTQQAQGTAQQQTPPQATIDGVQVEGLELDATKLGQVARGGPRRTYRIEVVATVPRGVEGTGNDYVKRLVAVWDTKTQNQNMRDPAFSQGSWVYWREE